MKTPNEPESTFFPSLSLSLSLSFAWTTGDKDKAIITNHCQRNHFTVILLIHFYGTCSLHSIAKQFRSPGRWRPDSCPKFPGRGSLVDRREVARHRAERTVRDLCGGAGLRDHQNSGARGRPQSLAGRLRATAATIPGFCPQ